MTWCRKTFPDLSSLLSFMLRGTGCLNFSYDFPFQRVKRCWEEKNLKDFSANKVSDACKLQTFFARSVKLSRHFSLSLGNSLPTFVLYNGNEARQMHRNENQLTSEKFLLPLCCRLLNSTLTSSLETVKLCNQHWDVNIFQYICIKRYIFNALQIVGKRGLEIGKGNMFVHT